MPNKMLIDASHPEETRVVVVHGNRIEEFDFESQDKKQLKGNIYLARVTRVEPSLQAAFVEYGGNRHGFLAFSEIHPDYYQIPVADRQAILRAEAEAAEEEDEEAESESRQERGRGRRRRRGGKARPSEGERGKAAASESDEDKDDASASAPDESAEDVADDIGSPTADDGEAGDGDDAVAEKPASIAAAVEGDVVSEPVEVSPEPEQRGEIEDVAGPAAEDHEIESVGAEDAMEEARNRRRPVRRNYKIQEVIKRRQILLVQVVKEERGNKGAALTTYLSLAGRYSVLMPNTARGGGISRKITNAQDRKRLKEVVQDLDVPQGMGVILRTAGESRTKAEIKRDYEYLMRLWETVRTLTLQSTAPSLVYEEGSLIKRSVRDLYNKDIEEIVVAGDEGYREAKDFMRMLMPSHAKVVQPHRDTTPIFVRHGIEAQLDRMLQPQVTLKSGGYIIINQTEALVSIDVNSGRSTREHSIEETALHTNLEASEEVARQLRLRDLAGLIVIDFIDMEENRNNRAVEKRLKDCLKNDRARIQLGRISHFGLMEMSRQRIRASVLESTMKPCPHCGGTGHVRSDSSVALLVVRAIEEYLLKDSRSHIIVRTPASTAMYVLNHKRSTLTELEARFGLTITIEVDESVGSQHFAISRGALAEKPLAPTHVSTATVAAIDFDEPEIVEEDDPIEEAEETAEARPNGQPSGDGDGRRKRRRRRRRGGRDRADHVQAGTAGEAADSSSEESDVGSESDGDEGEPVAEATSQENGDRKKRRRGKRGGRRSRLDGDESSADSSDDAGESTDGPIAEATEVETVAVVDAVADEMAAEPAEVEAAVPAEKPKRASRARKPKAKPAEEAPQAEAASPGESTEIGADAAPAPVTVDAVSERIETPATITEPVLHSSEPTADLPKKGGWWQRKGFF